MMQDMATGSKEKDAQLYKVLVIGDYAVGTSLIPPANLPFQLPRLTAQRLACVLCAPAAARSV